MISGWILALALYFTILIGLLLVVGMRILTALDIVVRAIPLGTPRVQERRPPATTENGNRSVGASSRHAGSN